MLHPADPFAAIVVKYDRLWNPDQFFIQHVKHFEEVSSRRDILHLVGLGFKFSGSLAILLAPCFGSGSSRSVPYANFVGSTFTGLFRVYQAVRLFIASLGRFNDLKIQRFPCAVPRYFLL